MSQTLTITVDDNVYETLKPFIEQKTLDLLISEAIGKYSTTAQTTPSSISKLRGSLHNIDTSDIREENDRVI
jgi:predicted CopG family antitoxin